MCLELGCGLQSNVRKELEHVVGTRGGKLIRVNPEDADVADCLEDRAVSVRLGALEALQRMQSLTAGFQRARYICRDGNYHGAEVEARTDASVGHIFSKAVAALRGNVQWVDSELKFVAQHPSFAQLQWELRSSDPIPEQLFFAPTPGGFEGIPVTQINVSGINFGTWNTRLENRIRTVSNLLDDMGKAFDTAEYQWMLSVAKTRVDLQRIIREVHLHVLPSHGFPMAEASPGMRHVLVSEMQSLVNSASISQEVTEKMSAIAKLSGFDRMQFLPFTVVDASKQSKAKKGSENGKNEAKADKTHRQNQSETSSSAAGQPSSESHQNANATISLPPKPGIVKALKPKPTVVILLRHGERQDYVALREDRGAEWVAGCKRPWDPPLAEEGHTQAARAARRLRYELSSRRLPEPTYVFSSPLLRCVQTASRVARHFGAGQVRIEEGLVETVCEPWMRQWAVPDADANWGGPASSRMSEKAMHAHAKVVQGPAVDQSRVRVEARGSLSVLYRTASDFEEFEGLVGVDQNHESHVSMRTKLYRWGHFESKEQVIERLAETVRARTLEHPGETLIFVSHGGPTMFCFEELTGERVPAGSGGMTAMSILRFSPTHETAAGYSSDGRWDALLRNDARHDPFEWRRPALPSSK